jgi:DNA-binding NtrC family response regulator
MQSNNYLLRMKPEIGSKIGSNNSMASNQVQVLLAVRDAVHSAPVSQALLQAGAAVSVAITRSESQLLERIGERLPSLLVLEVENDASVLQRVREAYPQVSVIALSSRPTTEMAFDVSRLGGEDLWPLPLNPALAAERIRGVLCRLQQSSGHGTDTAPAALTRADGSLAKNAPPQAPLMVGDNPMMAEIRETIEKVAGTDITVLIRGESGVGKEVVARMLFERSRRKQKPFVKVNCAAIPHDLLESELFGYEAGAFTGATRDKPGKFELANNGTLFLDEIAEMHPMLQAKLLHILQDGRFSRLGAKRDISVDVRILCATNKLLEERVKEGLFREDLLYRINAVTVFLPPLRERRDEIPALTDYLLHKFAVQYGRELRPFSEEVVKLLMAYDWPGNIRELENLCKRYVIVGGETQILRELSDRSLAKRPLTSPASMSPVSSGPATSRDGEISPTLSLLEVGRRAAWEAERRAIVQMLETTRWNRREAARRLQVSYKALLNKIKQMQLEDEVPGTTIEGDLDSPTSSEKNIAK